MAPSPVGAEPCFALGGTSAAPTPEIAQAMSVREWQAGSLPHGLAGIQCRVDHPLPIEPSPFSLEPASPDSGLRTPDSGRVKHGFAPTPGARITPGVIALLIPGVGDALCASRGSRRARPLRWIPAARLLGRTAVRPYSRNSASDERREWQAGSLPHGLAGIQCRVDHPLSP